MNHDYTRDIQESNGRYSAVSTCKNCNLKMYQFANDKDTIRNTFNNWKYKLFTCEEFKADPEIANTMDCMEFDKLPKHLYEFVELGDVFLFDGIKRAVIEIDRINKDFYFQDVKEKQ